MSEENRKQRPVTTIRLGAVEAAVWENERPDGSPNHSVTFSRSYKDGEEWKSSASYFTEQLPLLAKAADMAHTAILTELRKAAKSSGGEADEH